MTASSSSSGSSMAALPGQTTYGQRHQVVDISEW